MRTIDRGEVFRFLAAAVPSLVGATLAIALFQDGLDVPNPSAIYLLAVVATAVVSGTWGAAAASAAAFLLYNFLFVEPRYTFTVANLGELINLFLLLFVGFVVGQLAARQRARAEEAIARERESRALFQVSRELATRQSTPATLGTIVATLQGEAGMDRVWISLGVDNRERVAADTADGQARPSGGLHNVLQRMPGDTPAKWTRVHLPGPSRARPATGFDTYRVRIEAADEPYGSIWAIRSHGRGEPRRTDTRLLAAAADQIGQALRQDRLAAEAQAVEIARQSDALKSALLQSVSHDLRTPLATIRAAAGSLRPRGELSDAEHEDTIEAIDREVEYLNRLVTNLLDLSRIEAGALRAERDVFDLSDLVRPIVERLRPRLGDRPVSVGLDAPPVLVDPVFLDEAITNVVENAIKYTPPGTALRITAESANGTVRLTVEDAGPGVPESAMRRLFEKFYRAPGAPKGSRSGTGIGLAVVQGLVEAMGGHVAARRSELGGLAIDIDMPVARVPAPAEAGVAT